jgi:hypothetical protein
MPDPSLRSYEQDVERARSKLASDLATLRSPATFSAFTDDLKHEALNAKDAFLEKAKSTAQSTANGILEDLKAKAAANPAAVLTIGAGIAWRLIQHPPIATVLIGAGLFSLSQVSSRADGEARDYLLKGKERLKEQAVDLAASAKEATAHARGAFAANAACLVEAAKEKAQEWCAKAQQVVDQAGSTIKAEARSIADEASRTAQGFSDEVQNVAANTYARSGRMMNETISAGALGDQDSRNKLLLGAAASLLPLHSG